MVASLLIGLPFGFASWSAKATQSITFSAYSILSKPGTISIAVPSTAACKCSSVGRPSIGVITFPAAHGNVMVVPFIVVTARCVLFLKHDTGLIRHASPVLGGPR